MLKSLFIPICTIYCFGYILFFWLRKIPKSLPVKECFCLLWRVKQSMYIFLRVAFYYVGYELHFMLEKDVPVVSQRTQCVVPMHPTLGCTGTPFSNSSNCKYLQKYARSTGFREPQM